MPSHPTRRGLLALLSLLLLVTAVTTPALARNRYELHDSEGDPGDGVLNPAKPYTLVLPQTVVVADGTDRRSAWPLPVLLLPSGLPGLPTVFVLPGAAWRDHAARWLQPQDRPAGGRWHDAR